MKGDIIFNILEALKNAAVDTADLLEVFLEVGYGASIGTLEYALDKKRRERTKDGEKERILHNYYAALSRLKRDGLIITSDHGGRKFFKSTSAGKKKFQFLKRERTELPRVSHPEKADNLIIVSFDIPEKEKRKRAWLRHRLRQMGFSMIQKSVWIGKVRLPKDFIDSLHNLKLIDFVEIFEISKTGTLKHIA